MIEDITQTGIPQSTNNPLVAEMSRDWAEEERQQRIAQAKWKQSATSTLDGYLLDYDTAAKGKELDLSFDPNPERAKKRALVGSYLTVANDGRPVGGGSLGPAMFRDQIAAQKFGGIGVGDDEAFYGEIVKEASQRKSDKELADEIGLEARKAALVSSLEPTKEAPTFEQWRANAVNGGKYQKGRDFAYLEQWNAQQDQIRESLDRFGPQLNEVWTAMQKGGAGTASEVLKDAGIAVAAGPLVGMGAIKDEMGKKDAGAVAFEVYGSLAPEDRAEFMDSIGLLARTLPKEEQPAFFSNLAKQGGRDVDALGRNAFESFARGAFRTAGTPLSTATPTGGNLSFMSEAEAQTARKNYISSRNFASDVRRIEQGQFSAVRSAWGDGDPGMVESGLYGVPGALASSVVARYAAPVMLLSMEGQAYDDLRNQLREAGMSDERASEYADSLAPVSAAPQAILERFQSQAILGKLPVFDKVLSGLSDQIKNRALRMATRTAIGAVEETAIEMTQDMINPAIQDIAGALGQDVPDVKWTGEGGALEGFWTQAGTTFVTMLPLAILGAAGGLSDEARARAFAEATPLQRRAFGVTDADSAAIDAAALRGQSSLNGAIDQAMRNRVPESEQARQAVEELKVEIAAQEEAAKSAESAGIIPQFVRTPEGFTVKDSDTGQEIGTAPDAMGAIRLAAANSKMVDEANADLIAFLGSTLESAATFSDDKTTTVIDPFKRVTPAQQAAISAVDEARVMEQVKSREAIDGEGFSDIVLGNSSTSFKQGVRDTVNQINAGGSVLTVVHEFAHGKFRKALAAGRLTKEETIDTLRALDANLESQFRFLTDGVVSDVQLQEAVSELVEAHILRTRKDGRAPAGVVSKNLSALARIGGAGKKLKGFVDTIRDYFGVAFSRSFQIKKAIREGKVKESDLEAFMSKLFGLDGQDELDTAAAVETAAILGESAQSLGPAKMADALIKNAERRIKDPAGKAKMLGGVRDRLVKVRALIESRGTAYNFDAFGQPYAGEAKFSDERKEILNGLAMLDGVLGALPPDIRGKVGGYTQLAKLDTDEKRLDYLKRKLASVDRQVEKYLRKEYGRLFDKLLEKAEPKKDAGKKAKGKLGGSVHDLFGMIEQAMTWTPEKADAHALGLESQIGNGTLTPEQEAHDTLEAQMVRMVADWKNADSAQRASALQAATSIYEAGYAKFKLAKLLEKEDRDIARKQFAKDTGKAGTQAERDAKELADNALKGGWKDTALGLSSFEQVVRYIFGESAEGQKLVDREREASNRKEDAIQEKMDGLDDLFTALAGGQYAGEQLRWKMAQKNLKAGSLTMSEFQGIGATLMWRQDDGRRHMLGPKDDNGNYVGEAGGKWHYDQAFIDQIEAGLSPEAKKVRDHLAQQYAAEYARLNPVYREMNGVNLPFNAFYSPITVKPQQAKGAETVDPVTGNVVTGNSTTPGSLKTRGGAIAQPDFRDALQTFIAHTKQIEHWIAYAQFSADASAVLGNRELGNSIEAKGGKQALSVLRSWLDLFAQGGTRSTDAHLEMNKRLTRMVGRAAGAALVGRMSVLAVQSVQLGAALAEMPTGSYAVRLGKLFTGQLGWGAAMKSEFIQRRIAQLPPIVRAATEGLKASSPTRLKFVVRQIGQLIGGADALFTAGTYVIIHDYQLKQAKEMGLTGAEAEAWAANAAERSTERVAQPTRAGTRSLYENLATTPTARIAWAFASESRQKLALAAWAVGADGKSIGERTRAIAVTWVVGGMIATLIRAAVRDSRDDEDDEVWDDKNWGSKRLALSALTGPLGGIPVLGELLESGIYKVAGEYQPEGNLMSNVGSGFKAATRVSDWGDKKPDEIMKDVEGILSGLAVANDTLSAAASISHLARDLWGVVDNIVPD